MAKSCGEFYEIKLKRNSRRHAVPGIVSFSAEIFRQVILESYWLAVEATVLAVGLTVSVIRLMACFYLARILQTRRGEHSSCGWWGLFLAER